MSDPAAPPLRPLGRFLLRLSEALALAGGLVLLVVTALTVFSVIGRTALNLPLLGDSEIVEIGVAFSVFSFLAYCQMRGANVVVDFFTKPLPLKARNGIDAISNLVFALVVILLTWRLALGGIGAYFNDDTSMFLLIPKWWGYLAAFASCLVWGAACLYTAVAPLIGPAGPSQAVGEDTR